MFKKLFSFLIILSMTLALFTGVQISVSAEGEIVASGSCGESVTYTLTKNGGTVTVNGEEKDAYTLTISGSGAMSNISSSEPPWGEYRELIKNVEITDGVTSIGIYAFYNCSNLTSATIPDSVNSIGWEAFHSCTSLKSVNIPNGVTSILLCTFKGCTSLKSVTIPDSVNTIGNQAFENCESLETVTIPEKVTSIGLYAFSGCSSLKSVTIPEKVTSITNHAFQNCPNLETVFYPAENCTVSSTAFDGTTNATQIKYTVSGDNKVTISEIITPNENDKVKIPTTINGMDVVAVAEDYQKFVDKTKHTTHTYVNGECTICGGKENQNTGSNISHTVENGTLTISGTGAMDDYNTTDNLPPWDSGKDSITDIVIGDGVTSIGDNAFNGLTGLETVTIPDSVADIGTGAFPDTGAYIVYYESGAGVGEGDFPATATKIEYSVNEDGDGIVIENIILGSGVSEGGKVDIPNSIGGKEVVEVAAEVRDKVSVEGHTAHSYENGSCTICGAADPNAVSGSQGTTPTTPTTPSNPSYPSAPSRPSTPVVTPNVTSATETTATTAEEIIADGDYTGEDVSAGAGDNSDDGGITDMSMVVLVIAIAAVIAAAVLVKKLIF